MSEMPNKIDRHTKKLENTTHDDENNQSIGTDID